MKRQHHPARWFLYVIAAVVVLVTLGAGPIGLALVIMIGVPILLFVGLEGIAHSGTRSDQRSDR